jgi:serine/threonine-protein kinase
VWAPDGKHIAFASAGAGLFWIRSDGGREPQLLLKDQGGATPWSFSPDGRRLAYFWRPSAKGLDIFTLPLDLTDADRPKPGKPEPFVGTPADENVPQFSPDGRWIAYHSNESGNSEIYVRAFPAGNGGKWQISSGGGLYALWSNNGRKPFYESLDNKIMVVDYAVQGDSFVAGKPVQWSDKQIFFTGTRNLDLAPDGKRFAVFMLPESEPGAKGSVHVTMLLNFFDELKRKMPLK